MLLEETDPKRIQALLARINQNPTLITKLAAAFAMPVNTPEAIAINIADEMLSERWPLAVDPFLIANDTHEDREMRAEVILSVLVPPLDGLRFLDFGCEDGSVPAFAARTAALSVGCDIKTVGWDTVPHKANLFLVSEIDKLVEHAPYDVMLLFDVLDHLEQATQVEVLSKLKPLLTPNTGRMHVRFHPWTSRHANHAYKTFNKAFCHMFMTDDELRSKGHHILPTVKTIQPIATYETWIKEAGLKIINRDVIKAGVEAFFRQPQIAQVISSHWKESSQEAFASGKVFPTLQTEMHFVDFILA